MKSCLRLLFTALLVAVATPALVHAEDHQHTPMEESMEKLDDAYKSLSRALRAPDAASKASYLEWVGTIKAEAEKCIDLVPQKIAAMPAEAQTEILAAYKKDMKAFVESAVALEKAVTDENWDDANAVLKDMRKAKSSGHEAYKPE